MQSSLFENDLDIERAGEGKTYRAIRHDIVRQKQKLNSNDLHHPDEKAAMIRSNLHKKELNILELFAGHGNCTKVYAGYGNVLACEKNGNVYRSLQENTKPYSSVSCKRTDSFLEFHSLIAQRKRFDVVDLDPYGFPNRFFPDIFLLIEKGILFVTMPKPYVNVLNGITAAHLIAYYGQQNPKEETIVERIALWGLCHWRKVQLIDSMDCKSVWRFAFDVERVKATDYTGVRNQP